jgi:hypothetical protein
VVIESGGGDPGFVGDLADACGGIAAGGKEADGGIPDPSSGVGISLGYRSID